MARGSGAATMIAYILAGGLGLPFFSGGGSGMRILTGATAGYLAGFVVAAYVIGALCERGLERSMRTSLIPFLAGTLIIYACGVAWLSVVVGGVAKALTLGVLPFLPGDAIKLVAAALALPAAWRLIGPANSARTNPCAATSCNLAAHGTQHS